MEDGLMMRERPRYEPGEMVAYDQGVEIETKREESKIKEVEKPRVEPKEVKTPEKVRIESLDMRVKELDRILILSKAQATDYSRNPVYREMAGKREELARELERVEGYDAREIQRNRAEIEGIVSENNKLKVGALEVAKEMGKIGRIGLGVLASPLTIPTAIRKMGNCLNVICGGCSTESNWTIAGVIGSIVTVPVAMGLSNINDYCMGAVIAANAASGLYELARFSAKRVRERKKNGEERLAANELERKAGDVSIERENIEPIARNAEDERGYAEPKRVEKEEELESLELIRTGKLSMRDSQNLYLEYFLREWEHKMGNECLDLGIDRLGSKLVFWMGKYKTVPKLWGLKKSREMNTMIHGGIYAGWYRDGERVACNSTISVRKKEYREPVEEIVRDLNEKSGLDVNVEYDLDKD